jgi:hypothetical protein
MRTSRIGWVRFALAVFVVSLAGSAAAQEEVDLSTTQGRGDACSKWFYAQEFDKLEALGVTQTMADALAPGGGFAGFWSAVDDQLGSEVEMLSEEVSQEEGMDVYLRTTRFEKFDGQIEIQWVFDGDGAIAGFAIRPKQ